MTITLTPATFETWSGADAVMQAVKAPRLETIFDGRIVVNKVENGYVLVVIAHPRTETYVAKDLHELNELMTAAMVTFRLEQK